MKLLIELQGMFHMVYVVVLLSKYLSCYVVEGPQGK